MSESRNNGESRNYSPSRRSSTTPSYSTSRGGDSSAKSPKRQSNKVNKSSTPTYNNLDSIDELIERLESEIPREKATSSKVNEAYDSRRKKLAELKELQQQARREQERQRKIAEEEQSLPIIQAGNDELDEAISQIRQLVKKPTPSFELRGYTYWDDGESHDGESRW